MLTEAGIVRFFFFPQTLTCFSTCVSSWWHAGMLGSYMLMNSSWKCSALVQYSVMCIISQMPFSFMLTNHCGLMILLSHSLFQLRLQSLWLDHVWLEFWLKPVETTYTAFFWVLGSSSSFTQLFFQMLAVLCCHQEMLLGTEMKWGEGLSGFHFQQAWIITFFPSEAQFNASIKRIRSLFPVPAIFFCKFLASLLENNGWEKWREKNPFPPIIPALWPLSGGSLSLFWNSTDTKRLTFIPKWHSFELWYYDRRTCNL